MTLSAITTNVYLGLPDVTELLLNEGFETLGAGPPDTFNNWSEGGPPWPVAEAVLIHSGVYACKLPKGAAVTQVVTGIVPGHTYRLSAWTRGDGVNCGRYYVWDSTHATWIITHTDTGIIGTVYKYWFVDFVAPAGCLAVAPALLDPQIAGDSYFDDASLIDITPIWKLNSDVLRDPAPVWEYGIAGHTPRDLVASTGFLTLSLDNGLSNSAGKSGLYSPDHADCLPGFGEGTPIKVEVSTPIAPDEWEQEFDEEITDFDVLNPPSWDKEVDAVGDFDAETDPDGDLNDAVAAAHDGPVGLEITFDDANLAYGTMNLDAANKVTGVVPLWFNKNTVALDVGTYIRLFASNGNEWYLYLYNNAGTYEILGGSSDDFAVPHNTSRTALAADWNEIIVIFAASTGPGNDDGFLHIILNGAIVASQTGIDNDTQSWDSGLFGMTWTNSVGFGGSFYMDTIKIDPVGLPFASKLAARTGTYGMVIPIMDPSAGRYGRFNDPDAETIMVGECEFDPKTIVMGVWEAFNCIWTGGNWGFSLTYTGAVYQVRAQAQKDDAAYANTPWVTITDEYHKFRVEWRASDGPGSDNGFVRLFIDDVLEESVEEIDNDTKVTDWIRFGAAGLDAGTYGILNFDNCRWGYPNLLTKFHGSITGVRPAAGLYEDQITEVEAQDWMGLLIDEETGFLDIAQNKRADEGLTLALVNMSIQPEDTDFDASVETFPVIFHKESPRTSMATLIQRLARNEQGRIYLEGDGTLVFENRYARPMVTASSFTLDGLMTNFDISYLKRDVFNVIRAKIILHKVDAAATTILWQLQLYPVIRAGETLVIECPYRDPDTGWYASGLEIVDPITQILFGSVGDGATNDLISYLGWSQDIGSNVSEVTLINNGPADGYLNQLEIIGKGLYTYDPIVIEERDQTSIDAGRGERVDMIRLEYIAEISTGKGYATYLLGQQSEGQIRARSISFLANQSDALAKAAIQAEPGTRFTAIEEATGISSDFFINRLKYRYIGLNLWLDILAVPVPMPGTFIWDSSHWDDEDDARWAI